MAATLVFASARASKVASESAEIVIEGEKLPKGGRGHH